MSERIEHLDEGTVHAWLDGALAPDESARVEVHAAACPACAALVAEARGLVAASSRILASLDDVPAGVIPGTSGTADQLAILRARRAEQARRWWRDPRYAAAASVVFMAGALGIYWNASRPITAEPVPSASAVSEQALPAATAPVDPTAAPAAGATSAAEQRQAVAPPSRAPAAPTLDTGVELKAVTPLPPPAPVVANEAAPRIEQAAKLADAQRDSGVAVGAATSARREAAPRAAFDALRQDSTRVGASDARARSVAAPQAAMSAGLRLRLSDPEPCFVMQMVQRPGTPLGAWPDTIRLTSEISPVESDPAWFRAEAVGAARDTVSLYWRPVDSVTVEVRRTLIVDGGALRFRRDGQLPDVERLANVWAALARVCR